MKRFTGQTILLTLPDSVEIGDLKWLSVWSRLFRDNFGDFIFDQDENTESFEVTTNRIGKCFDLNKNFKNMVLIGTSLFRNKRFALNLML